MMIYLMKKFINARAHSGPTPQGKGRRFTGQGMVEFALALPILLLVVYGLLETGRLIFIYSSTVTASRQAARYGSATGSTTANIPYYRDCTGIRNEAKRVAFLNTFTDANISITYDRGLDSTGGVVAIPGISTDAAVDSCNTMNDNTLRNGDRIKVQVTTQWEPIIRIVPSWQGFNITSSAERTILMTVPIGVDPEAEIWVPGGALQLTVSSPVTSFNAAGQTISYQYILYNNANFDLNAPFTVADNIVTNENCIASPSKLSAGSTYTCTGSYVTTQADVDAGFVTNLAIAKSLETTSNQTGITVPAIQNKSLTLSKTANPTVATTSGAVITYTYTLTNSGNVTLSAPFSVTDNKIASNQITCPANATIAPNASIQCTATYTITSTDIANASVTNTATAKAFFNGFDVTSNVATAKVNTAPLDLTISASPTNVSTLNQKITYTYTLKNVGSTALNAPYAITDNRAVNISCSASTLSPGSTVTCTGEYYVTQADLDNPVPIVNNATATANGGAVISNSASASVTVSSTGSLLLTITPPANPGTIVVGTVLNYTYVVKNNGNTTLTGPFVVTELNLPAATPTCPATASLLPNATMTCTLSYTVKQSDMDKGSIINLAIAKGKLGTTDVISPQATATVLTYIGARLTVLVASTPESFQNTATALSLKLILRNTGSVTLSNPIITTANITFSCTGVATSIGIGQETYCTASYTPVSADLAAGSKTITATGTAKNGAATLTSTGTLTIPSTFVCVTSHGTPSITFPRTNQMAISITNSISTSDAINIKSIKLSNWNYSSHPQQFVSSISLGGIQIYNGTNANRLNPVTFSAPFFGTVTIFPGETKTLLFAFNKNYVKTNNELIQITFAEFGCSILSSGN
jgi:uncharacterized repeat protein (TIGR01451 family)